MNTVICLISLCQVHTTKQRITVQERAAVKGRDSLSLCPEGSRCIRVR
jgi:hypothetical protein